MNTKPLSGMFWLLILALTLVYVFITGESMFSGEDPPVPVTIEDGSYELNSRPWEVVHGDFNHDGNEDIAVNATTDHSLGILLGNGDGTFQDRVDFLMDYGPKSLVTADFDKDGHLDIVTACPDSDIVAVIWGFGDGTFGDLLVLQAGDYPSNVIAGDVNLDGNIDLCTSNSFSSDIGIYIGDGNGNFSGPSYYYISGGPRSPEFGDIDEDGNPDIVVSLRSALDKLGILFGDGNGAFGNAVSFRIGQYPKESVVRDFNGDGHLDVAVACRIEDTVKVVFGNGDGTFSPPDSIAVGIGPRWLISEDVDGDGVYDLIVTNFYGQSLTVLFGDGAGGFPYRTDFDLGASPRGLTLSDFDHDEKPDLAVAIYGEDRLSIILDIKDDTTPFLISPSHGSVISSDPTFRWKEVPGASSYQLLLNDSSDQLIWTKFLQGVSEVSYDGVEVLVPGGEYKWSVRDRDNGVWKPSSPFYTFQKEPAESLLAAPTLRFPQEGNSIGLPELFSWSSLDNSDKYILFLYDDSTTTTLLYESQSVSSSLYIPAGLTGMTQMKDYYWQVRGVDEAGYEGEKSDVGQFYLTDIIAPPQAPLTVSPSAEDTVQQDSVTFVWLPSDGASHFTVELSTDSAFSPSSDMTWTVERIADSLHTVKLREGSSRMHWRVMAVNSGGESIWSNPVAFEYDGGTIPLINSAEILDPAPGTEVEFGSSIMPYATISGSHSGIVEGVWLLGTAVIDSFSLPMTAGEGVRFNGPVIVAEETGLDTLVLSVTSPESVVSSPVEFEVVFPSAGEVAGIQLVTEPFALPADSQSQSTITAYMVDSEGRRVYSDYARLIGFGVVGEGTIVGPPGGLTDGGIVQITVQSTAVPDKDVLIFAYSLGIPGSSTYIMTYEKELEEYVTRVLAYIDRLENLQLDYYPEEIDTAAAGFDLSGVRQFLNDEILGVPEPLPESVESLRRLSLALKYIDMSHYYRHSQSFPEEDEQPLYGIGSMFDHLSGTASNGALVANFLAQMADTILLGAETVPEAIRVSDSVIKSTQHLFDGVYLPALELARDGSLTGPLYGSLVSSHQEAASFARDDEDPQTLMETYTPRLDRQLEFLNTYVADTQYLVDSIAGWVQSNTYSATFEEASENVDEQLSTVRSMTQTVFLEAERLDVYDRFHESSSELSLLSEFINQGLSESRLVGKLSRAVDYICYAERWSSAGEILLPTMRTIEEVVSNNLPEGVRAAFGFDRGQSFPGSSIEIRLLDAGDKSRIEESLVFLSEAGMQFESAASLVIADISENDSSGVAGRIEELCDSADNFLELMYLMRGTLGSFGASASKNVAGYDQLYWETNYLYLNVIDNITTFETAVLDYLFNIEYNYTSTAAVQSGFDAITVVNDIVKCYSEKIPTFFDLTAVPALVPVELTFPDSVGPSRIFRVNSTLVNTGSGDASTISAVLSFEGPFEITSPESVLVTSLAPGDSVELSWVLRVDNPGTPGLVRGLFSFSIGLESSNSLGYPRFFHIKVYNKSFGVNHHVIKMGPFSDGKSRLQSIPKSFSLYQNSPNPFNPQTSISYDIPEGESQNVVLRIYNLRGKLLSTIVDEINKPGRYTVYWNGRDDRGGEAGTGIYFYVIHAGPYKSVRKMVLRK